MDMILAGFKWQICFIHLDDAFVFSRSAEENFQHLYEVLKLPGKAEVTLKAALCHLFQEDVEYVGHVISP